MSNVYKKNDAEHIAFNHKPKALRIETTPIAKDFVSRAVAKSSDFLISDVVAKQSGVQALRKQQVEAQVEETVLIRLKEIEEEAYKQAYDLGIIEGTEKAYEEKRELLTLSVQHLDESTKGLNSLIEDLCRQYESIIMQMVYRIAERIAMRSIAQDEKPILELINKFVTELQAAQKIKIRLNPGDLKFVEDLRNRNMKEAENLERVKFEPKDEISRGGCLIETDFGTIDATVEQRVEKAWQAIESKLPNVGKA